MQIFLGTVLIVVLCCLGLGLGQLLGGRPLRGGCASRMPGAARCAGCPHRDTAEGSEETH